MRVGIINIVNGEVNNPGELTKLFKDLTDCRYQVTIKNFRRRTLPQNAYLHGVVIPLVYEGLIDAGFDTVNDHEDAKMIIKDLFLRRSVHNEKTNTTIEIIRNTSELTTIEMMEFIEKVQRWSADYLGVVIPDPSAPMPLFKESIL